MASSRIPPLLEPYLGLPPEASLIVLTSVLGASTNWLTQRYLCSFLATTSRNAPAESEGSNGLAEGDTCVVLVSFMRDFAFWKEGMGRLGLDLDGLSKKQKFKFVDGLSGLFSASSGPGIKLPLAGNYGQHILRAASLAELQQVVQGALQTCVTRNIVLVLDNPDLLLAASGNEVSAEALKDTLLNLRENVTSTVVTLAADEPLVSAQSTSLEKDHAAVTLSLAHEAEMVVSLRLLDTGTARDVSGVLRVTPGGDATGFVTEERELLYFVGGDGGVRVFERGQ
ncbi:hypothetical protein TruAng_009271 [Truncatella angustata]|nr:hypothetical protein TruAng_009271 [Truncatella angustata]